MLSALELKHFLQYDPDTGLFAWNVKRGRHAKGAHAGTVTHAGYVDIAIAGKKYGAHRLAWLYTHDEWPKEEIDHINGDKADNRIANLRKATRAQNSANCAVKKNNITGFKGVQYDKTCGIFYSLIRWDGRRRYLGAFKTAIDAHNRYLQEAKKLHGEFANLTRDVRRAS